MAMIDGSAAATMELASQVLIRNDVIARQRKQLWALMTVLRLEQQRSAALCDLVDSLLADESGDE